MPVPRMGQGRGAAAGGKSSAAGESGGGDSGGGGRRLMYKKERGGASRSPAGKLQAAGPDWARPALNKHGAPQGCQSRGQPGRRIPGGRGGTSRRPQLGGDGPLLGEQNEQRGLALPDTPVFFSSFFSIYFKPEIIHTLPSLPEKNNFLW